MHVCQDGGGLDRDCKHLAYSTGQHSHVGLDPSCGTDKMSVVISKCFHLIKNNKTRAITPNDLMQGIITTQTFCFQSHTRGRCTGGRWPDCTEICPKG